MSDSDAFYLRNYAKLLETTLATYEGLCRAKLPVRELDRHEKIFTDAFQSMGDALQRAGCITLGWDVPRVESILVGSLEEGMKEAVSRFIMNNRYNDR